MATSRKNTETWKDEPKRADHGQMEQSRVEGPRGKGQVKSTREHKEQRKQTSKKD